MTPIELEMLQALILHELVADPINDWAIDIQLGVLLTVKEEKWNRKF